MRLSAALYSRVILPLVEPTKYSRLHGRLQEGISLEKRSLQQNEQLQWERVKRMLEHAYATVPFYKQRFQNEGITPEAISSPQDLAKIPFLTRDDIRNHFSDLTSTALSPETLLEAATGGTTDTPVRILRNPDCIPARNAIQMQFNTWAGVFPGDKVFWLWGARSDYPENPSWRWRMFDRHLMHRVWAPISLLNEEIMAAYSRELDVFRPKAIMAYPSPLAAFCEYLLETKYKGHVPTAAICTAEPVLVEQRIVIEKALQCQVFEHYGTRDFGMVAAECELHDGLHVNPQAVYFESIPITGATDGLQELAVTELLNLGFPLIRYKINDCVHPRLAQCSCGRGFPLISNIEGRVADNFYLPTGEIVPGVSFTNRIVKSASGIKKLQVIQERPSYFAIKYIPDTSFSDKSIENLRTKLNEFLGSGIEFEFQQVQEIEREKSGKTRLCISRVHSKT